MKVEIRNVGPVTVLDLHGKFAGRECYERFHDAVDRVLDQGRLHVVVNLAAVPWADTAGVGALMAGYYAFVRQGGKMKFAHLTPRVDDVFFTLDLRHILEVYDTEAQALASFSMKGT